MDKGDWMLAASVALIPVVGAASAVILEKAVSKYGHTLMKVGPNNFFLIGIIGAVQNLASIFFGLSYLLRNNGNKLNDGDKVTDKHIWVSMVLSHALTAATLTALTALAAKVNLISARLTLFGAVVLMATSLIENRLLTKPVIKFFQNGDIGFSS